MSPAGERLLARATRLVEHCSRAHGLVRTVLDWTEAGHYDPIADMHMVRLPGPTVRALHELLNDAQQPPS